MNRKIISLFTLLAFIIFSLSCYTPRVKEVRTAADLEGKNVTILSVATTSGEHIEFLKDRPGRIHKDNIIGTVRIVRKEVEIDRANIKDIIRNKKGKILAITNKDGNTYYIISGTAREEEDKIIFSYEYESISIPLSEVKSVRVKRYDAFKTISAATGCVAGMLLLVVGIIAASVKVPF